MNGKYISARHTITRDYTEKQPFILSRDTVKKIADQSLEKLKDTLKPLQRTGDLEQSWNIISNSTSFSLWSGDWAASSIQTGFSQPPPKDVLLAWMGTKSEFANLDAKESARVAYAIRLAMSRNQSPGPTSTIGPMQPSGERRFDYFAVMEKEIIKIIQKEMI